MSVAGCQTIHQNSPSVVINSMPESEYRGLFGIRSMPGIGDPKEIRPSSAACVRRTDRIAAAGSGNGDHYRDAHGSNRETADRRGLLPKHLDHRWIDGFANCSATDPAKISLTWPSSVVRGAVEPMFCPPQNGHGPQNHGSVNSTRSPLVACSLRAVSGST